MRHTLLATLILAVLPAILTQGCAQPAPPENGPCDLADPQCPDGRVCERLESGEGMCSTPFMLTGVVLDATTESPIGGALVQAVDVNGAAVGTSAQTAVDGTYTITVPALRDESSVPIGGTFTLRSQAATYQAFPSAIRPALPIDASSATQSTEGWVLENSLTTIKLLPLPGDTTALGSISGTINANLSAGLLVIAEDVNGGLPGLTDTDGLYIIFNVPAGTYTVKAYAAGVQIEPTTVEVMAGEMVTDVELIESTNPLSMVSGSVQIVDASGNALTSVVLAIESTFVAQAARGEVPPGLRIGDISSDFTINDVPDGRYVVLAAFENDDLVRDPDQTISGTSIVSIEVPDPVSGNTITINTGFKVTGALDVVSPGVDGPEEITTPTPILEWSDDSSEDGYELRVFDAFGNEIWMIEIGSVSGSSTVTQTYAGPVLVPGMFYQFKATSFRERLGVRTAISTTEDLKGVFQLVVSNPDIIP